MKDLSSDHIAEIEAKIEEAKKQKNDLVRNQQYEEATRVRDTEKQLTKKLMELKKAAEEKHKNKTIVVNLFAGPGVGKSTFCAGIFFKLKLAGVECEMALEYAKDLVWEGSTKKLADYQLYVFNKQFHRVKRVLGKVDVVITDSPILLSPIYDQEKDETFKQLALEQHAKLNTLNYFLERKHPYNPNGRQQTLEQAIQVDTELKLFLLENKVTFSNIEAVTENIDVIVAQILEKLNNR